jgi:hypothetical protein
MKAARAKSKPSAAPKRRDGRVVLAALQAAGVEIIPAGRVTRHTRRPSHTLCVSIREIVELASQREKTAILWRIHERVRMTGDLRSVWALCGRFATAMQGRRGFSARRLYNDYYKRLRLKKAARK